MLLAFTDESYSDLHYYQAAFIINEIDLPLLDSLIEEAGRYAMGFGIAEGVEFHGNAIMSATKGWEPLEKNFRSNRHPGKIEDALLALSITFYWRS